MTRVGTFDYKLPGMRKPVRWSPKFRQVAKRESRS
jgi:hypothetical protein